MVTLVLGVIDQPYLNTHKKHAPPRITKSGKLHKGSMRRLARQYKGGAVSAAKETTGDVAELLEAHYGIMARFMEAHGPEIEQAFAETMENALVDLLAGAPMTGNSPYGDAEERVKVLFQQFIESEEMARMGVPGVPTKAALKGINLRLAHPYAKGNPRRPSFVMSGLFLNSFEAWVEE